MNTIGINNNLDRARIRKLFIIGLFASLMTGAGDFLLGFGEEIGGNTLASNVMSNAMNLSDAQLIWGGLLGFIGLFLEGLVFFGVYRLVADAAPKYAHISNLIKGGLSPKPQRQNPHDLSEAAEIQAILCFVGNDFWATE